MGFLGDNGGLYQQHYGQKVQIECKTYFKKEQAYYTIKISLEILECCNAILSHFSPLCIPTQTIEKTWR